LRSDTFEYFEDCNSLTHVSPIHGSDGCHCAPIIRCHWYLRSRPPRISTKKVMQLPNKIVDKVSTKMVSFSINQRIVTIFAREEQ